MPFLIQDAFLKHVNNRPMKHAFAILGVLTATSMAAVVEPSGVSSGRWVAWTDAAPKKWEDAFVTGNGRHGMMVMSQPGDGRIIFVHEKLFFRASRNKIR